MDIWDDGIKEWFSAKIKPLGVKKCYFPLFITKSALEQEANHVEGFAAEVTAPLSSALWQFEYLMDMTGRPIAHPALVLSAECQTFCIWHCCPRVIRCRTACTSGTITSMRIH
jgi:hypothetical protein